MVDVLRIDRSNIFQLETLCFIIHRRHVIQEGSDQKPTKVWREQNDNLAASRSSLAQFQKN